MENAKRTGITVKKRGFSYWPNFTVAKKSAKWNIPELVTEHVRVVIGFSIQILTATQTREQQSSRGFLRIFLGLVTV
jgi:hypothetical protein